jgi:3-oxoacyl-[acyl-carrier protein] reductase
MTLEGRTALVTGSGRNIGAAIALALAEEGANVVVNVRHSLEEGERVTALIRERGVEAELIPADVSDSSEVKRLAQSALSRFERIDILVNNVGISPMMRMDEMTDDFWDLVLRTSLSSAFYCMRELVGGMAANGWGRVVNIGGQAGIRGTRFKTANAAAKAGIIGLTRAVANEWAEHGITCNHIGPGSLEEVHELVYYEDRTRELDPTRRERLAATIPAGRLGTAQDIADACAFLVSDKASYITGQTLLVNGGMMFV